MSHHLIARALLRLYPQAWRRRYEAEILALIDETGLTPSHALDLARGAASEWTRATSIRARRVILEGVFLPYEKRIQTGFERFFVGAIAIRLVVALLVFCTAQPIGRWLTRIAGSAIVDSMLSGASFIWFIGLWRVATIPIRMKRTPADDAQFVSAVDKFPLPRINRWVAIRSRGILQPLRASRRLRTMSVVEGAFWMLVSVVGVSYLSANRDFHSTVFNSAFFNVWENLYHSFLAAIVIVGAAAAVIRRTVPAPDEPPPHSAPTA